MFIYTIKDVIGLIFSAIALLAIILFWSYLTIPDAIRRHKCKHDAGVWEDSSCNAFCNKCRKNLGFIGSEENKVRRILK